MDTARSKWHSVSKCYRRDASQAIQARNSSHNIMAIAERASNQGRRLGGLGVMSSAAVKSCGAAEALGGWRDSGRRGLVIRRTYLGCSMRKSCLSAASKS
jgi:hypothetical protein